MRRGGGILRGRTRTRFANVAARLGFLFVALALLSQSLAFAAPMGGRLADARAAQAQLSALLGPGIVVCTQSDEPDGPTPADCHDSCPLCRLAADSAALDLPTPPGLAAPVRSAPTRLLPISRPRALASAPALHPLPRGPPSKS